MRMLTVMTLSLLALAACSPRIPNSAAGVGTTPVTATSGAAGLPAASPIAAASLDSPAAIAADTAAVLGGGQQVTGAPLSALAPDATATAPASLSDEQNFVAVTARETIESDAARIAANRAQYEVIQPTDLPPRPNGTGASIVAFALATNNDPGQGLYQRSGLFSQSRYARACARYPSPDRAQEAFLDAGGPKRDRYGMDPDGDGFACDWDPRPFRAARGAAPEVVETYEVVETPGES